MFLSKSAVCDTEKTKFIKKIATCKLVIKLRTKAPLSNVPKLLDIFYNSIYTMNEIVNTFSLAR